MAEEPKLPPPDEDPSNDEPARGLQGWGLVQAAALLYTALALVAVLWRTAWKGEEIFFASAEAAARAASPGADLAIGIAAGGLVIAVSAVVTRTTRAGEDLARALAEAIGPLSVPQCLLLALLSGVAEEAFFRGALQPRVGLVLASLIFGLVHFAPRRELYPWTAFSVVVGFLLGGLFSWTGNLLAPIAAHTLINAVNLPILVRSYAPRS